MESLSWYHPRFIRTSHWTKSVFSLFLLRSLDTEHLLKVTVLTLELVSPTLPPGKTITFNLTDPAAVAGLKKNHITIKEDVEYKCVGLANTPLMFVAF